MFVSILHVCEPKGINYFFLIPLEKEPASLMVPQGNYLDSNMHDVTPRTHMM